MFDEQILLQKIKAGDSIDNISKYFGLSYAAIYKKCKECFGCSIEKLRDKNFNFNGFIHTDGNYKNINKEILLQMIEDNLNNKEICNCLNISNGTLHSKCMELFGVPIEKLRNQTYSMYTENVREKMSKSKLGKTYCDIYGEETANKLIEMRSNNLKDSNNPNYKNVDKSILYNMIHENVSTEEILKYFNISKQTLYKKIKKYFNTTLKEMRKNVRDTEKFSSY